MGPPLQALAPTPEAPGYAGVPGFLQACGWGCPAPGHRSVLRDLSLKQPLCPSPPQTDSVSSPKWGVSYLGSTSPTPQAPVLETQSHLFGFIFFFKIKKKMWITFLKACIEFVLIQSLVGVLISWLQGKWDLRSLSGDRTHAPCAGRRSLNHWTTREVPQSHCLDLEFLNLRISVFLWNPVNSLVFITQSGGVCVHQVHCCC